MSAPTSITSAAVEDQIRRELIDLGVEEDAITSDVKFDTLDIDSLDVADMLVSVKRQYGVTISRAELVDVTIGEFADRIVASQTS